MFCVSADLAIEQPIKFEVMIIYKAAKQIGLTIPPNMLPRSNRVGQNRRKREGKQNRSKTRAG